MGIGTSTRSQTRRFPTNSEKELMISNKLKSLKEQISEWQTLIEFDYITVDSVRTDYTQLKGEIHSLYQESIYAHAPEKLSYNIIGLVSLIDQVKHAALRLIRNEAHMAETTRVNNVIASNAIQRLSQSDPSPCDNNSIIIAGGCSGYNSSTYLTTQASTGTVTATLQLQQGGD